MAAKLRLTAGKTPRLSFRFFTGIRVALILNLAIDRYRGAPQNNRISAVMAGARPWARPSTVGYPFCLIGRTALILLVSGVWRLTMGINAVRHTNTVFHDILKLVPWTAFETFVAEQGDGRGRAQLQDARSVHLLVVRADGRRLLVARDRSGDVVTRNGGTLSASRLPSVFGEIGAHESIVTYLRQVAVTEEILSIVLELCIPPRCISATPSSRY